MLVKLGYGVDEGATEIASIRSTARATYGSGYRRLYDPFWRFYGRPYYSRYGYCGALALLLRLGRSVLVWRLGGGYGGSIRSYTVYKSHLDLDIVRRGDNARCSKAMPRRARRPTSSARSCRT